MALYDVCVCVCARDYMTCVCVCVFVRACVRACARAWLLKQQPHVVLSRITKSTREGLKVRANVFYSVY